MTDTKNNLIGKLCKIMKEIGNVPKLGYNSFHKYHFARESDLMEAVQKLLADNGVFVFTSTVSVQDIAQGDNRITRLQLTHTFTDGVDSFVVHSFGEGADKLDKGLYKAYTGAMKYFIMKNFLISTNDDSENDEKQVDAKPVSTAKQATPNAAKSTATLPPNLAVSQEAPKQPTSQAPKPAPSKANEPDPDKWIDASGVVQWGDLVGRKFDSISHEEARIFIDDVTAYAAKTKRQIPKHWSKLMSAFQHKAALGAAKEVFGGSTPDFADYEPGSLG